VNWLAHVFLSEADTEFQLGNLFADIVKGPDLLAMSPGFRRGVDCHRAIDSFTDRHPITIRSRSRVSSAYGRYSGILIDLFYDHFLCQTWERYADVTLRSYTESFYREAADHADALPDHARFVFDVMRSEDLLGSYSRVDGVAIALGRVAARLSSRVGRTVALEGAVAELTNNYDDLAQDFAAFFPSLREHVRGRGDEGHL
jgi:acyl carrier protein phosphodiesterase